MGKQIDQKVVEMRFDNGQFEKGVSQSRSSIEKLKASLEFSGSNAQISGLQKSLSALEKAFSPLGVAWRTVWGNMVSVAQSAVGRIANEFNQLNIFGQFDAGFQKYTDMTKSVQTIMSATRQDWEDQGDQMDYVSDRLAKLNWYTDETSWAFVDMTSNIGKFTSAGIDLDTAVTAMQGIGNWAGISGAGVAEMSRAMYNLSQAMSMDGVMLRDWMSIENANMATIEFKQTAIDTAVALGTLEEAEEGVWETTNGTRVTLENFRTTLNSDSGNWFNSDVLVATLSKYGSFNDELYKATVNTNLTATELLQYITEYKDEVGLLGEVASSFEIEEFDNAAQIKLRNNIEAVREGTKSLDEVAQEYGVTVDIVQENFNKFGSDLIDFHALSKETGADVGTLIATLSKLSDEEYELGLASFKASQESKTLEDSLNATKDAVSSAWMNIWTAILGDYLEAKDLWTAVTEELWDIFVSGPVAMTRLITKWGDEMDGRALLFEGIANIWNGIKETITLIGEGISEIFPPMTAEKLYEMTEAFNEFSKKFILVDYAWNDEKGNLKEIGTFIGTTLKNIKDTLSGIGGAIKDAWDTIFPPKEGHAYQLIDRVHEITEKIKDLSEKFKLTDTKAEKLKRTFAGVFAVLDILKQVLMAIIQPILGINMETGEMGDGILNVTAAIGDWLVKVRDWLSENNKIETVVQKVVDFISAIPGYVNDASVALTGMSFGEVLSTIWDKIKELAGGVRDFFDSFKDNEDTQEKSGTFFENLSAWAQKLKEAWESALPYIQQFFESLKSGTDEASLEWVSLDDVGEGLKTGGAIAILAGIAAIIWKIWSAFNSFTKDKKKIVDSFTYVFDSVGDAAQALKKNIQAKTFKTIATAILEIAAAIFILALLDEAKMMTATGMLVILFGELAIVFALISRNNTKTDKLKEIKKMLGLVEVIIATFIAGIFLIATQTDIAAATAATAMIGVLLAEVAGLFLILGDVKLTEKQAKNVATVMDHVCLMLAAMGVSLMLATAAGDWKAIGAAGVTMFLMLLSIFGFMENLDKVKITKDKAANLATVMDEICKVLLAMGAALLIATIGGADWTSLAAAGAAMSGMMIAMAVAFKLMPDKKTISTAAEGMALASVAFMEMGVALMLATAGGGDWSSLLAAGAAMSGMLIAMAVAFRIMPSSDSIIKAAGALAIASVGILALAIAMKVLSTIKWEEVGPALVVLAGALVLVLAAGLAATYISVGLLVLGGAVALLGAGALMAGLGMMMFVNALDKLFNLDPSGLSVTIVAIVSFFAILPMLMEQVGLGILAFIQVFVNARDLIYEAFVGTFSLIIDAYIEIVPKLITAIASTVSAILEGLRSTLPILITLVQETIVNILNAAIETLPKLMEFLTALFFAINAYIVETAPTFVQTVFFVLQLLFNGLVEFTHTNLPVLVDLITFVVTELVRSIVETSTVITAGILQLIWNVLDLIAQSIGPIIEKIIEIGFNLIIGFLDGLAEGIPRVVEAGMDFVINLCNGVAEAVETRAEDIRKAIERLANALINAFKTIMGINSPSTVFDGFGKNIIQGLIDGIKGMIEDVKSAISSVADKVTGTFKDLLGIESPSKVFKKYGRYVDEGLADGMSQNVWMVRDATDDVGNTAVNGMRKVISKISDTIENGIDAEPTIRPVLDLSNVTDGIGIMDDMIEAQRAVDLASSTNTSMNHSISLADRFAMSIEELREALGKGNINDAKSMTQSNVFNITGDNPKEIADEVSNILQNQIERKDAVWA